MMKVKVGHNLEYLISNKMVFGNASAAAVNKKAVLHLFG
jgi:hypothetical protein